MSREQVIEHAVMGVELARKHVDDVEFSAEDARTAPAALLHRHFEPLEGGAWRAGLACRKRRRATSSRCASRTKPARSFMSTSTYFQNSRTKMLRW